MNDWQTQDRLTLKGRYLDVAEETRRLRAYARAKNDAEAARALQLKPGAFTQWRRSRKLPALAPRAPRSSRELPPKEHARRMEAYLTTNTDAEAARALGIAPNSFAVWRRKHGFTRTRETGNRGGGPRVGRRTGPTKARPREPLVLKRTDHAKIMDALRGTDTDAEAADAAGVPLDVVTQWRERYGLNRYVLQKLHEER